MAAGREDRRRAMSASNEHAGGTKYVLDQTFAELRSRTVPQAPTSRAPGTGVIYCDDNLHRLSTLPSESVDLIYLDPPFFSNRHYEVIWGDEAEVRSFADRWAGGIEVYIDWMRQRIREMHRVLSQTGSLYLHCDSHASHYLKVMVDEVFGAAQFRNEIIWRRTASNSAAKRFGPIHQTIFYYAKSAATPFYPVTRPYSHGYVHDYFTESDDRGRYRPVLLTGPGRRQGESGTPWRGYNPTASGRHWQPSSYVYAKYTELTGEDAGSLPLLERLERFDNAGLIHWPEKPGGVPNYKFYLADAPGVFLQDIWAYIPGTEGMVYGRAGEGIDQDVKWLSPKDKERMGYPTQKPEGVLERIIRASSKSGDVVLDPFCGCGTTIAVAERLGRRWIGIDISPTACALMKRRVVLAGASQVSVIGMPKSLEELLALKPFEFQNWVIDRITGVQANRKTGDMGIDGWTFLLHEPVQVKQSERIGREVIDRFETAIKRARHRRGFVVGVSFTKGAREEVARARQEGLDIHLLRVSDLLERPDWVMLQMGVEGGLPHLKVTPMPVIDPTRHSAEELIKSAAG